MNTLEKTLYYLALAMVLTGAVMRIFHVADNSFALFLMNLGFLPWLLAYAQGTQRLKSHIQELEEEVRQLRLMKQ